MNQRQNLFRGLKDAVFDSGKNLGDFAYPTTTAGRRGACLAARTRPAAFRGFRLSSRAASTPRIIAWPLKLGRRGPVQVPLCHRPIGLGQSRQKSVGWEIAHQLLKVGQYSPSPVQGQRPPQPSSPHQAAPWVLPGPQSGMQMSWLWHTPPTQSSPSPHATPQAPQLLGSLTRLTHSPSQYVPPSSSHVRQAPSKQTGAAPPQTWPHAPQLLGSESRSVQFPSHTPAPSKHSYWHWPFSHQPYS